MGDDKQAITAQQVSDYLAAHPDFFVHNADILEVLELTSAPEGTISLAQRQTARLNAKNSQLQEQLQTLIDNARQNMDLQARVHELCLQLMDAHDLTTLLPGLFVTLKQQFSADEVALRLFYGESEHVLPLNEENISQLHIDDNSLKIFDKVLGKHKPVCGRLSNAQKTLLFPTSHEKVASIACLPIGHEPCGGLLAIASYEQNRFDSNMATDYLSFLGEVLMRLLRTHYHLSHDQ
jgi:uncharacterized protein YigA (DUF484 family)